MEYICHRRFNKITACGKKKLYRKKDRFNVIGNFITDGASAICMVTSEDAHKYFARNDDGNGLERGRMTWTIAYSPRRPNEDNEFRFTEEEAKLLFDRYVHFLRYDSDNILFNHAFFNAELEDIQALYNEFDWG